MQRSNRFKSSSLFPYLRTVRPSDRATEFKQRCEGLKIRGVTLHSYRYDRCRVAPVYKIALSG